MGEAEGKGAGRGALPESLHPTLAAAGGEGAAAGPAPALTGGKGAGVPKGAGKGVPPPPQLPGKGTGKGALPAPPPTAAKGAGKGRGKGALIPPPPQGLRRTAPLSGTAATPPAELRAPAGSACLRTHQALRSAEGTVWEGLDLWGAAGEGVLECAVVDAERLQALWGPLPEPPLPMGGIQARRQRVPEALLRPVEIAVRAQRLDPDLVRRGLMEDSGALSAEQADVLFRAVVPRVQESEPHLRLIVEQRGAASLSRAEAVLWTLAELPALEARTRVIREQHFVDDDLQQVQQWVNAAEGVVTMLKESKPLRTVLQTILAVRNILGQSGHPGYSVAHTFDGLPQERLPRHRPTLVDPVTGEFVPVDLHWFREHNPSVLTLAAEMLESTHESRCRLRFLRMLAVGRCVKEEAACRLVWSFLDDLQESPRDAMQQLAQCSSSLCNRDLVEEMGRRAMQFRHLATRELAVLRGHPSMDPTSSFARQLDAIGMRFADVLQAYDDGCHTVADTAVKLCRLGGGPGGLAQRGSPASFDGSAAVLRSLRILGAHLGQEMADACAKRRQHALAVSARAGGTHSTVKLRRHWAPVDTSGHTVVVTSDPDIVRQLRWRPALELQDGPEGGSPAGQGGPAEAGEGGEEARAREEREDFVQRVGNLIHGGVEGVYRRDPVTGRWGRRLDGVDGTGGSDILLGGPRPDI
uniref:Uncharacterized protein n=1 Tax=Alexandrium monilatum TaxID=311494 RepID=A0A7S4R9D1_9DINO